MASYYGALFHNFLDGIIIINESDFNIVETNPAITKILGYTRETLIGRHLSTIFDNSKKYFNTLNLSLTTAQTGRSIHADGERIIYLDITISPISIGARSQLVVVIRDITEQKIIVDKMKAINKIYTKSPAPHLLLFRSNIMKKLYKSALKLNHDGDIRVLIQGERGTGRELIARMIHYGRDESCRTPFIKVNCAATLPELFEVELFGHEKKPMTGGSRQDIPGKLELATGGTILFEEIEMMPPTVLLKLLKMLKERDFRLRIIAMTSCDLEKQISGESVIKELFHGRKTAQLIIPPLRQRKEDIAPLANHFLRDYSRKVNGRFKTFSKRAMERLLEYNWPGNIRELQNVLERLVLLYDDTMVRSSHLSNLSMPGTAPSPLLSRELNSFQLPEEHFDLKAFERKIVKEALNKFDGNKTRAAQYLGLTRSALRSRLDD